jgi:hypothetical protein
MPILKNISGIFDRKTMRERIVPGRFSCQADLVLLTRAWMNQDSWPDTVVHDRDRPGFLHGLCLPDPE